jgi:hypothetical protein
MKAARRTAVSRRHPGPALAAGLGLAVVVLLLACRSGPPDSSPQEEIEPLEVGAATLDQLRADGKTEQYELARDGWLTFAEYDQMAHTTIQCLKDAGAMIGPKSGLKTGNNWSFSYGAHAHVREPAAACVERYWNPLGTDWSFTHGPSQEVYRQANNAFAECLREGGLAIEAENPNAEDFHVYTEAGVDPDRPETLAQWNLIVACSERVSDQFNLPPGFIGA